MKPGGAEVPPSAPGRRSPHGPYHDTNQRNVCSIENSADSSRGKWATALPISHHDTLRSLGGVFPMKSGRNSPGFEISVGGHTASVGFTSIQPRGTVRARPRTQEKPRSRWLSTQEIGAFTCEHQPTARVNSPIGPGGPNVTTSSNSAPDRRTIRHASCAR
jgi:hypothetical protein